MKLLLIISLCPSSLVLGGYIKMYVEESFKKFKGLGKATVLTINRDIVHFCKSFQILMKNIYK